MERSSADEIPLPQPNRDGDVSILEAIETRRSHREFANEPVSMEAIGTLCWAAQGITDETDGFRAAPSAGATYPIEVTVVVGESGVDGLDAGVYRYGPEGHRLRLSMTGDVRADLQAASLDQAWVGNAPASLVVTAVPERTARQYGDRGRERYVPVEVGHVGQNIYLAAEELGLGTVMVGAFDDEAVGQAIDVGRDERPFAVYPIGRPR